MQCFFFIALHHGNFKSKAVLLTFWVAKDQDLLYINNLAASVSFTKWNIEIAAKISVSFSNWSVENSSPAHIKSRNYQRFSAYFARTTLHVTFGSVWDGECLTR